VAGLTHPNNGVYCIEPAAGIDTATAVLVATPDFTNDGTFAGLANFSHPEWASNPADCPAGRMEVETFVFDGENSGANTGNVMTQVDQPFSFSILPS
jgi:hypothetical protein